MKLPEHIIVPIGCAGAIQFSEGILDMTHQVPWTAAAEEIVGSVHFHCEILQNEMDDGFSLSLNCPGHRS